MALQKVNRNLINSALADSSDATAITIDSSENTTFTANVSIADDKELIFGASSDLKIYHSGNVNYIKTNSDLPLKFFDAGGASMMEIIPNGAVNLYHNGNAKLSTNSGGVTITGTAILGGASFVDNATAYFGTDLDLRIYHDGSHARLRNSTGNFNIQANDFHITDSSNTSVRFYVDHNGATALYFNGSNKLLTTNTGISVAGQLLVNPLGLTTPSFAFTNDTNTGMTRPTGDTLQFVTGGTARVRISSGGSLLVGRDVENSSASGHRFTSTGFAAHIVANDYPLLLNRLSSDGPLLTFRKDSATVGAVDSYAGIIQFGQGNVNLKFSNAADAIIPANDSGSNNNAAIDLGLAGVRFKDLFLSGTTNTGAVTLASGGVLSQTVVSGGGVYHTINHTGNEAWSWAAQSGQGSNDYLDVGISGGTRVMTWHEDGKVGIGTADPGVALTVQTYTGETDSFVSGLMLTATSTGTTIPGFGPAIQFQGERNNGVVQNTGLIANMADVNSGANISSGLRFYCSTAGVLNERVRMHYDGEVSIGNTVTIGSGSKTFLSVGDGSGNASLTIYTGTSNYGYLNFADGTSGAAADPGYIRYNHNDNTLYTNRVFSGDFNDTSDERLKENIVDLADGSTNIIKQLKPRTFDWKDSDTPNQTGRAGFIAQEIATVLPNEVYGYLDETKSVNVTAIVAHLVKTVQELEARINTLEG